nr:GPP34 family phosphoprotein [Mobilitalea sibirica]
MVSIIIELVLMDHIKIDENSQLIMKNPKLTGIQYYDDVLDKIKSKKTRSIRSWMEYFYTHTKLRNNIFNAVVDSIIKKQAIEVIGSSSKKDYSDYMNIGDMMIQKIRAELLEEGNIDENTMYLVLLMDSNKMLTSYFSDYEYKSLVEKMEMVYESKATDTFKIIKKAMKDIEALSAITVIGDLISSIG